MPANWIELVLMLPFWLLGIGGFVCLILAGVIWLWGCVARSLAGE